MTQSVIIINTSNMEGENIKVDSERTSHVLKPGEKAVLNLAHSKMNVSIALETEAEIRPFKLENGTRLYPMVSVGFKILGAIKKIL